MRVHASLLRRLGSDACGAELLEFALVLPVLVMLLLGAVWIGRAVSVYQALGRAAREGARVALASTCATCGNGQTDPTTTINNALTAASLDYTQASVVFNNNQALDPGDPANYQVAGVTVSITYPVQLNIPFTPWNGASINLSSTVSMRQEF
jgi:Flp pilus assembly protein TadG